jgi:hypothetical protein
MPTPSVPKRLLGGATLLSFLLALVSLFPEVGDIPVILRVAGASLPILVGLGWWVAKVARPKIRVGLLRHRGYDALYAEFEREQTRGHGDRMRLRELTRLLTLFAMFPKRIQAFSFPMLDVIMQDAEFRLTLGRMENAPPSVTVIPRVGAILQVIDPEDGFWHAELEVVEERSNSGRRMAKVLWANPLFKSVLVQRAMAGEALMVRARALYFVESGSGDREYD